ncbi:MAG: hypothetical protein IPP48_12760 [Chitinophagaceae bacterium]|nr:hypothetical protein [Chitinophagaceae bacterium]
MYCNPVLIFSKSAISQTVGLGNFVWWDLNDNGSRDSGEPVASGYTVYLYQDNDDNGIADAGFTTKTTTTNYNGEFSFTGLAAGKYFVKLYAGYSHYKTTVYGGDPDNNIMGDNNGHTQDLATTEIFTQTITLATGTEPDGTGATNTNTNNTIGIGMWKANGLGDMVWIDNNGNGIYETGEPGLPNVTVKLKNSTGGLLATTTTDAEGKYYFYDPMGYYGTNDYQVEFVTPDGYSPTTCNVGGDDELDSDPVNGTISSINVPMGNWNHSFDAGFKPNTILPVKLYKLYCTIK